MGTSLCPGALVPFYSTLCPIDVRPAFPGAPAPPLYSQPRAFRKCASSLRRWPHVSLTHMTPCHPVIPPLHVPNYTSTFTPLPRSLQGVYLSMKRVSPGSLWAFAHLPAKARPPRGVITYLCSVPLFILSNKLQTWPHPAPPCHLTCSFQGFP